MVFADLDLARRLERTEGMGGVRFVEARQRLAPEGGFGWVEVAGALATFDGVDSPITQTFGLGMHGEPADSDLDSLEAFFRERGSATHHEVSPLAGVPLTDRLCRRGYRPLEFTSVMYRELETVDDAAPADETLRTRLIQPGEEKLWAGVSARGWATEHPGLVDFIRGIGAVMAAAQGTLCLLAEIDGQPAGAGALRCEGDIALFAGACTVPEFRRRGVQRALLAARKRMAVERGCRVGMMCAAPGSTSQRNAERQGFRIAYTRVKWQLPAPGA